jgi:hypothetical protein
VEGSGGYVGVGLRIRRGDGGALQVCGRSGEWDAKSDALEGVGEGDALSHVDGVPLDGKGDAAVRALLLGPPGSRFGPRNFAS